MKFGVVVFPGSNCDIDCYHALKDVMGQQVEYIWHKSDDINDFDCIVLPGGHSTFFTGNGQGNRVCTKGEPGNRHMQRFSDINRSGIASRYSAS